MKRLFIICFSFFINTIMVLADNYQDIKVVAHRGFWKVGGAAPNSIAALVKADSIGCHASEFDVWLASDGELVVNHDPTFQGFSMEQTPSTVLTSLKLSNGENLPLLTDFLKEAKKLKVDLVLELKGHSTKKRETEAVRKILQVINELGLEDRMLYISFSLHAIKEFYAMAPEQTPIMYLTGNISPLKLSQDIGNVGIDYHYSCFYKNPDWIKECKSRNQFVNVWTVNNEKDCDFILNLKPDYITTDEPLCVLRKLGKKISGVDY